MKILKTSWGLVVYDQVNVYLVILMFNDFSYWVLWEFQIAYGIEAGFFFFIIINNNNIIIITCQSNKNFSGFVENSHKNNEFW